MSCFVISEWNGMSYEDSDWSVVAVFHLESDCTEYIRSQPELSLPGPGSREGSKTRRARFFVQEFDGSTLLCTYKWVESHGSLRREP